MCPPANFAIDAAWGPPSPGDTRDDPISRLGLSPAAPQRAAAMFLLYHTARAALGCHSPPRLLELARAAVREASVGALD